VVLVEEVVGAGVVFALVEGVESLLEFALLRESVL
jgi:hypothetical protein